MIREPMSRARKNAEAMFKSPDANLSPEQRASADYNEAQRKTLDNMARLKALRLGRSQPVGPSRPKTEQR